MPDQEWKVTNEVAPSLLPDVSTRHFVKNNFCKRGRRPTCADLKAGQANKLVNERMWILNHILRSE